MRSLDGAVMADGADSEGQPGATRRARRTAPVSALRARQRAVSAQEEGWYMQWSDHVDLGRYMSLLADL